MLARPAGGEDIGRMSILVANLFTALCLQLELDTHGRNLERIWRDSSGRLRRTWMPR